MIPEKALEKALEGGWQITPGRKLDEHQEVIALDPTFWQALAKALGWWHYVDAVQMMEPSESNSTRSGVVQMETWHAIALRLYDVILSGGDTEAFWNEILGTNNTGI